jgi:hypothetical protein
MRKIFILLFVVSFSPCMLSQNSPFFLSGRVLDAGTKMSLKNVSISINGTLSGTLSDSTGAFDLQASGTGIILNFSMLGYEKKTVNVKAGTKEPLTIELVPKASQLAEISISATAIETVSKSKRYHVLDYDFYKDNILMITYVDLNKAKLVLITTDSDTLGYKKIPYEPNRLFKDCMGNLHVVCKDSIYQAFYNGSTLTLLPAKSIRDFENILLPCVAQDSSNFYLEARSGAHMITDFKSSKSNNYIVTYTGVNKKSRQRFDLATIADEKTINQQAEEDARQDQKIAMAMEFRPNTPVTPKWIDNTFLETIVFTEVYTPLYHIKNAIYIFDYVNHTIKCYDKLNQLTKTVPIDFHKTLHFSKSMQVDPITSKAFAIFESNGISELKEIDPNTGLVNASCKIPFVFTSNIKVYDNYIYFIRKEKGYDGIRFLSRLKII